MDLSLPTFACKPGGFWSLAGLFAVKVATSLLDYDSVVSIAQWIGIARELVA